MQNSKIAPSPITFEEALAQLEEITKKLEQGSETLEDSMLLYEQGIELKNFCASQLKEAEGKWTVIEEKTSGDTVEVDIDRRNFDEDIKISENS